MHGRAEECQAFLEDAGWGGADITPLAGDASQRRYFRARKTAGLSAIVMDAPPPYNQDMDAFLLVAKFPLSRDFSAPNILFADVEKGFALLEDLGDDSFSKVLLRAPRSEELLYRRSTDVLIALAREAPPQELSTYGTDEMVSLAALPYKWYHSGASDDFETVLAANLNAVMQGQFSIALRDFHVDNLIWLPERTALRSVGLLDFQDAKICHPAYDVISLFRDVRRDVSVELQKKELRRYQVVLGLEPKNFELACHVLSAQRNLRILGVFSRLAKRDGKVRYLDHLPRVWRTLMEDLEIPELDELQTIVCDTLPPPNATTLNALR